MPAPASTTSSTAATGFWLSATFGVFLLAIVMTAVIGWLGLGAVEARWRTELRGRLIEQVETSELTLELWGESHRRSVESWAKEPVTQAQVVWLAAAVKTGDWKQADFAKSKELADLRAHLTPVCQSLNYVDFVVIDTAGRQIGSFFDHSLGEKVPPETLAAAQRAIGEETVLTPPYAARLPLPDSSGGFSTGVPTMLIIAPVYDDAKTVVAVLGFRLRPEAEFNKVLTTSRPGESGETYAFNKRGLMLSDSRFHEDLRKLKLLDPAANPPSRAMLTLELRDPGGNLLEGFAPTDEHKAWPLTRMARRATNGDNGYDITGYRDYRGVPVVGAWRWLPHYGLGIAHEIDVAEAYAPLRTIRRVLVLCLALLAGALGTAMVLLLAKWRADKRHAAATTALAHSEERFSLAVQGSTDGIWDWNCLTSEVFYSPRFKQLMGYEDHEISNQFAEWETRLHPDDRERVLAALDEHAKQRAPYDVEYRLRTKSGAYRWFRARGEGLWNAHGTAIRMAGSITDITAIREVQAALEQEQYLLKTLMENVPDNIYFKDASSRIIRGSRAMADKFGVDDPAELVGRSDSDFFSAEHANAALADEQALMASGQPILGKEEKETWPDGHVTYVSTSKLPLRDEQGRIVGTFGISRDVTEQRRAEEYFRLAFDVSLSALMLVDREGRFVMVNTQAEKLFGYDRDELRGKFIHQLVPAYIRPRHPEIVAKYFEAPRAVILGNQQPVSGTRKDGSEFPVEVGLDPLDTESGKMVLCVVTDITERKAAEHTLRKAKEAAESASRAKSEFLANMSHEIRTPMNGIIGMTELALDTFLTNEQREYLLMVQSSAEHLLAVINDVLDFSKIEAGRLELETIGFCLRELLDDTVAALAIRAHKKGLELALQVDSEVPDQLQGDPTRLRQVLANLIGNAVKFTERGEVVVRVTCDAAHEDGIALRFSVSDTGIGIPQDKQSLLFKAFSQVDASTTRKYGGTGLGLAISAQIVQLMGGNIWLESEAARGSTFYFTAQFAPASDLPTVMPEVDFVRLQGLPVLVVDDNDTNRRILAEVLTNWRMRPICAASADDAWQELQAARERGEQFVLILLDGMMPETDGFALAERIKEAPELAKHTVMMLSSADRQGDAARCKSLGIAAHLTKPVRQSLLLDTIMTALGGSDAESRLLPPVEHASARVRLRVLLAEDNAVNQKLAVRLLEKRGHDVTLAVNGRAAVEAMDASDFDVVLMDVQMPEMDGFEATAEIRHRERHAAKRTPIVAMTAHAMKGDRERCLAAGMDDYVSKPLLAAELFRAVEQYSSQTPAPAPSAPEETTAVYSNGAVNAIFDRATALERVGGDEDFLRELIGVFIEEVPGWLREIDAAAAAQDWPRLQRGAHTVKGAAGNLGAQATATAALEMELAAKAASGDWGSLKRNLVSELERLRPCLSSP